MFDTSMNPYIAGNPVGKGDCFIGRRDILREVNRVFSRRNENAIVLFGQRRIGKTSVLQYLEKQLSDNNLSSPIYFDLQDKATLSIDQVVIELANAIAETINIDKPDLGTNPASYFESEWLPTTLKNLDDKKSIVLLFDEFDVLATKAAEQQAGFAFFPYLRKLLMLDTRNLNFVFVIGRNVNDLDTIALSLFKGIPTTRVSLLNEEDTYALCRLSDNNGTLKWSEESLKHVWEYTNGHAFFTQQLCSHVWEHIYDKEPDKTPKVTSQDVDAVIQGVLDSSRNTLEWLWDGLPPAERIVSSALAEAGKGAINKKELQTLLHESGVRIVIRELEDAPRLLKDWDLLESVDEGYRFRVELLRHWIKENKPLNRVQEELDKIHPVAENLFLAAQGIFKSGDLKESEGLLGRALSLNPNHIGANKTLADIFLAENRLDDALTLLKNLYEFQPVVARSRLTQALLAKVDSTANEEDQLNYLKQLLEIDPYQKEAREKSNKIWNKRGDIFLEKGEYTAAEKAYSQANNNTKIEEVILLSRRKALQALKEEIKQLEQERSYTECIKKINEAKELFSDLFDFNNDLNRIKKKLTINALFSKAQNKAKKNQIPKAQTILSEIISIDPNHLEAIEYLYELNMNRKIKSLTSVEKVQDEAQINKLILRLKEEIQNKKQYIEKLTNKNKPPQNKLPQKSDNSPAILIILFPFSLLVAIIILSVLQNEGVIIPIFILCAYLLYGLKWWISNPPN